ncbi:glycosyltransferase family 4 protein [Stenotrophomonas sp.]|uniref:glycosyltransferase family 4 protein n=1 Tax=Stenotrophomonas sp. TaxID=69392 RepID=UPI0028A9320C|nr:glycosyltransferase family 4 protein [Stenotrophomonas sp.]
MLERWTHNRWVRNRYTRRLAHWARRAYALLFGPDAASAPVTTSHVESPAQSGVPSMPLWLQEEMLKLAALEPELLPPGTDEKRYAYYSVPMDVRPGDVYARLSDQIGAQPYTHVMLVPWLKPGGADRGILYHARAIAESDPAARILVLTTENSPSPWASRLPSQATLVEFGQLAASLDFSQQVAVMVRALVQMRAPVIHLVNSRVGWEAVLRHGLALTQHSLLVASLYCDDYDLRMNPVGYARDYLRYCYSFLTTVICDNSRYPQVWSRELGVPASLFTVVPFPYDGAIPELPVAPLSDPHAGRVLWAGRLDRQKRPDLLAAIAAAMPKVQFDVYGAPVMAGAAAQDLDLLKSLKNVTLHGEFKRLEEVASSSHFAYLHTTAWEGTPTILFDVAAARLPICAPAVGGIVDFLPERDLVPDPEDVAGFVQRLEVLRSSAEARQQRVEDQRESLEGQRQWPAFVARLGQIEGYLRHERMVRGATVESNA